MSKKLSEMTLEELWKLFPIHLEKHNPSWLNWYNEEAEYLKSILPSKTEFHHIGSTAVNDIMAKPIIDILIVTTSIGEMKEAANTLANSGYNPPAGYPSTEDIPKTALPKKFFIFI